MTRVSKIASKVAKPRNESVDLFVPEPVGRLRVSLGTRRAAVATRRKAILLRLIEDGQLKVLAAVKAGDISIDQLDDAARAGELKGAGILAVLALRQRLFHDDTACARGGRDEDGTLPTHGLDDPCVGAVERALPLMGQSAGTRRRYATSFEQLRTDPAAGLSASARVRDLLTVPWKTFYAARRAAGRSAADWNHIRRVVSSFLTIVLGDVHHEVRRDVMKAIPTADEGQGRTVELTVDEFWTIVEATPEHARPCYVALAATGMRLSEYLACTPAHLHAATHAIRVPGTKTGASADTVYVAPSLWPWIEAAVPSPLRQRWMWIYWDRARKASHRPDVRLHDLRHLYAQLASDAGVPTAETQAAMRHTDPKMTRRYERRGAKKRVAGAVGSALTNTTMNTDRSDAR